MKIKKNKKEHIAIITIVVMVLVVISLTSCATQQSYPPTSPEAHTKNFIQALFENPFK